MVERKDEILLYWLKQFWHPFGEAAPDYYSAHSFDYNALDVCTNKTLLWKLKLFNLIVAK